MKRFGLAALGPTVSLAIALIVTSLFLLIGGYDPVSAFTVMWQYGIEPSSLVSALGNSAPIYLAGIAAAFALRMGLFNIGIEGQYRISALVGAVVAASIPAPWFVTIPITLIICAVVGGLWALVPALLRVYRGVNEVITSILMSAIATALVAVLLSHVFRADGGLSSGTATIKDSALIPALSIPGSEETISSFTLVAFIVGIVYYVLVYRSRLGYGMQIAALSPDAARSAGISVKALTIWAMVGSGAIAGLVGMHHVLDTAHRFDGTLPTDLMFTGLAAALLGKSNPIGIAAAAFILAFVARSAQVLGLVGLPTEVGELFIAVILLSSAIAFWLTARISSQQRRAPTAAEVVLSTNAAGAAK